MDIQYWLEMIGTFVFAISGIRLAAKKEMDLFGAAVIGFVTAIGGGTTRDVILGSYPVVWVEDLNYPLVIFLALPFTLIFRKYVVRMQRTLFIFDTIGIALFTISGMQKVLLLGYHPAIAITMDMVSATVGGVIRDVLSHELPLIFRKEIYATACLVGALAFYILQDLGSPTDLNYILTVLIIVLIRIVAIRKHLAFPKMK